MNFIFLKDNISWLGDQLLAFQRLLFGANQYKPWREHINTLRISHIKKEILYEKRSFPQKWSFMQSM
jgi:hypothetical protein